MAIAGTVRANSKGLSKEITRADKELFSSNFFNNSQKNMYTSKLPVQTEETGYPLTTIASRRWPLTVFCAKVLKFVQKMFRQRHH